MDSILIDGLAVPTHIGVPDAERMQEQTLKVSVWLSVDTKKAAQSDDIMDTIDYDAVAKDIRMLAQTERKTVERFAGDIADHILATYKPASVTVSIDKHILPDADRVALTITRP